MIFAAVSHPLPVGIPRREGAPWKVLLFAERKEKGEGGRFQGPSDGENCGD
jgi:hypothetical protein